MQTDATILYNSEGKRSCILDRINSTTYNVIILSEHCVYNHFHFETGKDGVESLDMLYGPFITVGESLQSYDENLPDKKIENIACDKHGVTITLEA